MAWRESTAKTTYVRFQTRVRDEDSHRPGGVFQAAFALRDSDELPQHEQEEMEQHLSWLRTHLKSPSCLDKPGNEKAIAWFHPRATKPIRCVRAIVEILRENGVLIDQVTTRRPGKMIYEDHWQIVAKPFRE